MLMRASSIFCRQTLSRTSIMSQGVSTSRYIHLVSQVKRIPKHNSLLNLYSNCRVTGIPFVRYASTIENSTTHENITANTITNENIVQTSIETSPYDEIPDPPIPLEEVLQKMIKLHPNGEPTLSSLGLGSWSPPGLVQQALELMHINWDIPWWTTIVIGTVVLRCIIFPLVIISQRNMINFSNHMPKIQELQANMTEARQMGDHIQSSQYATELIKYMKQHDVKFARNFMVPLIQAPIFISCFLGLRQMANLPVESLKHGGYWWLQDLTMHDPYYIMPIVTCVTMYITIELGSDGTNLKAMGIMRYIIRIVPFVMLPFILHFPGVILTYWASTNFVSLIQTGILKIPQIRKALNIPIYRKLKVDPQPGNKKKFLDEIKQSWTNMKITKQVSDRERADLVQFNAAGKGPIVRTFKYDPTKQKKSTVLTKSR